MIARFAMGQDTLRTLERSLLDAAAQALGRPDATGLRSADAPSPEVGDLAIGCHGLAKELQSDPQALAQRVVAGLAGDARFRDARADKGYVNVRFERGLLWRTVAVEVARAGARFGADATATRERWLVEYSGPNTNKPLHIGHLRNTILGFAMSNVVELHGFEVTRYNIVNDRGIHICKSMVAYREFGGGVTPQSSGEKGDHLVGRLYSLFAKNATLEFEEWAKGPGAAEIEAFAEARKSEIAAAADLGLRKRFLGEQEKAGRALPFKPAKIKPQLYPEKMKAEAALEADYAAWLAAHAADAAELRRSEGLKKAQAAVARRFEAEVSRLHAKTRDYLRRWEADDPEVRTLWRTMNGWVLAGIEQTYRRLGVRFDYVDYESDVYLLGKEIVGELLAKGVAKKNAEGAIVFEQPGKAPGEPPAEKVLLRADGTSVYITQDVGSLVRRYRRHEPDRIVYVVGSEQELHFETLFALVDQFVPGLGARCVHLSYGMVELPHGKMKSREGEIVEADGFLDTVHDAAEAQVRARNPELQDGEIVRRGEVIALAAVKYNLLKFSKRSTIKFDVDEALDMNGKTGPYCLYAVARIRSILRKVEAAGGSPDLDLESDAARLTPVEAQLLLATARFPAAVSQAVRDLEPYHVADHVYRLAKEFNSWYTAQAPDGTTLHPVVQCSDQKTRALRVSLLRLIESALENGLHVLGIATLQEM
jgi:arginyl-tRNA synthetase